MPEYNTLGSVPLTATADTTGFNPGNWTNAFLSNLLPTINPQYEIYHMTVMGGLAFAGGLVYVGRQVWSTVQLDINGTNEWDPSQPLMLKSGQELYFFWNTPVTSGSPPLVTVFPRYDILVAG